MAKTGVSFERSLRERLQKLAAFEPQDAPVVSLYLNLGADQHGRDNYQAFCRKSFADQMRTFEEHSAERVSLERDIERIDGYLSNELNRSANGLAVFASAGGELFEAIQVDVAFEEHWLFIGSVPHIYPLVRLIDQYPRYAAVLLDTNRARIFVFALGAIEKREQVVGVRTRRTAVGGWSQARYQRHVENFHLHHVKEVVDTLDRLVRSDNIQHVIISGDGVAVSMLQDELPVHLKDKVVSGSRLDRHAEETEVVEATLQALQRKDAASDSERVAEVIDAWRSGGLGVVGPEATMHALQLGQVDELLISSAPQALKRLQTLPADAAPALSAARTSAANEVDETQLQLSDELVRRAQHARARVRIIEDPELLRVHGGVAALLRFRVRAARSIASQTETPAVEAAR
jgi:peptide chain release factor subunit 1